MSKIGVNLKIDVSKIEKARLFKGKNGTYLDATVFIDLHEKDQYDNNGMITQAVSKDEKAQGAKGAILGNCKVFWTDDNSQQPPSAPQPQHAPPPSADSFDDDIPF